MKRAKEAPFNALRRILGKEEALSISSIDPPVKAFQDETDQATPVFPPPLQTMAFLKLLLAFLPWISFLVIAHGSLFRIELGLGVALAISIVMGLAGIHRGIILWTGLVFFTTAFLSVTLFRNMWTVRHLAVLANGTLATASWVTILIGKPFTLDYARTHTDPMLWENPNFLRSNVLITAVWASTFTTNTFLAWGKERHFLISALDNELLAYALLLGAALFTTWYPARRTSSPP
jgi:hypothetical protein